MPMTAMSELETNVDAKSTLGILEFCQLSQQTPPQQHDISKGLARKATQADLNPGPTEAPGYMRGALTAELPSSGQTRLTYTSYPSALTRLCISQRALSASLAESCPMVFYKSAVINLNIHVAAVQRSGHANAY
jgi:hypothetical protein